MISVLYVALLPVSLVSHQAIIPANWYLQCDSGLMYMSCNKIRTTVPFQGRGKMKYLWIVGMLTNGLRLMGDFVVGDDQHGSC